MNFTSHCVSLVIGDQSSKNKMPLTFYKLLERGVEAGRFGLREGLERGSAA